MTTAAKAEKPTTIDEFFETATVEVRGRTFTFRELSAEEYDKCVELATSERERADGSKYEHTDMVQLLRWMMITGSVEPKMTAADLGKLPFGVMTEMSKAVNDLHFRGDGTVATPPEKPAVDKDGNEIRPNS